MATKLVKLTLVTNKGKFIFYLCLFWSRGSLWIAKLIYVSDTINNYYVLWLFLSLSGISVSSNQNTFPQTEALIPSLATGVVKKITGIIQTVKQMVGDLISTRIPRWILKWLLMYVGPEAYHLEGRWYASGRGKHNSLKPFQSCIQNAQYW